MKSICEIGEMYLLAAVVGHFVLYTVAATIGAMIAIRIQICIQDWRNED